MPRPSINLDSYRPEIERQAAAGDSQNQIREWLLSQGISISKNIFSSRIVDWKASRSITTSSTNPALIAAIEMAFHTTQHDDQTIAQSIISQGIPTTHRQVKAIRLAHNWHRRAYNKDQETQQRAETFALVEQALQHGECRCYGRELMRTYLRVKFRHNARDDDVEKGLIGGVPRVRFSSRWVKEHSGGSNPKPETDLFAKQ